MTAGCCVLDLTTRIARARARLPELLAAEADRPYLTTLSSPLPNPDSPGKGGSSEPAAAPPTHEELKQVSRRWLLLGRRGIHYMCLTSAARSHVTSNDAPSADTTRGGVSASAHRFRGPASANQSAAKRWFDADRTHQLEIQRTVRMRHVTGVYRCLSVCCWLVQDPAAARDMVSVCGCCYRVYEALEAHRKRSFGWEPESSGPHDDVGERIWSTSNPTGSFSAPMIYTKRSTILYCYDCILPLWFR